MRGAYLNLRAVAKRAALVTWFGFASPVSAQPPEFTTTPSVATDVTQADALSPPSYPSVDGRYLGDHLFPKPMSVPLAFPETHFTLRQGMLSIAVPDFPVRESGATYDVHTLGMTEVLEAGVEFLDRFEVFGLLGGQVVTGTDIDSIVTLGSSYAYFWGGGALARLFTLERSETLLSLRAEVTRSPGGTFELLNLVNAIVEADPSVEQVIDGRIGRVVLSDLERTRVSAHAVAAQAIGQNFGVQAALGISHTWSDVTAFDLAEDRNIEMSDRRLDPDLGVEVDGNLSPWLPPLDITLEYSLRDELQEVTSATERGNSRRHLVSLGVNYVDPRFQIGVSAGRAFGIKPLVRFGNGVEQSSGDPSVSYVRLLVHINW